MLICPKEYNHFINSIFFELSVVNKQFIQDKLSLLHHSLMLILSNEYTHLAKSK